MIARGHEAASLQPGRFEIKRLVWAFAISLAVHGLIWGGYKTGEALGLWDKLRTSVLLKQLARLTTPPQQPRQTNPADSEPPLVFVEVNPAVSTAEAPKNAKYYSDKNSQAANVESDKDTDTPKISGSQEHVPKTDTVTRNDVNKLQPMKPSEPTEEASKPKPTMSMGDLALAKPDTLTRKDDGQADRPRPRTIQEALSRQQLSKIPGQQMKQDGGTRRLALMPSLDTRATPFGAYDAAFIEAVSQQWYNLLDARSYSGEGTGRVVLRFRLKYDGTITDMRVLDTTVDGTLTYLCQQAVLAPSPYEKWPSDMRHMVPGDYRELTFTFFYN